MSGLGFYDGCLIHLIHLIHLFHQGAFMSNEPTEMQRRRLLQGTATLAIGQLALDMYASSPKSLVWRGNASKTLDPKAKPEKQQKNLDKAVVKLLKNYPPPVKK